MPTSLLQGVNPNLNSLGVCHNNVECQRIVQWFRRGLREGLFNEVDPSPKDPEPFAEWAYEFGLKLSERVACEASGHDDHVMQWSNQDPNKDPAFIRSEIRSCRKCDRVVDIPIFATNDRQAWDDYWNKIVSVRKKSC